jgi:hypothetical protein
MAWPRKNVEVTGCVLTYPKSCKNEAHLSNFRRNCEYVGALARELGHDGVLYSGGRRSIWWRQENNRIGRARTKRITC